MIILIVVIQNLSFLKHTLQTIMVKSIWNTLFLNFCAWGSENIILDNVFFWKSCEPALGNLVEK